jgi:phospholipid/cholesterol/gamma-HCH transport system substrate-binding protein
MKRDRVNYFVVGVFVLTVGAAFLLLLYRLTGSSGPADGYHVFYQNVTGLKYGTGIYYEGYQIGQVEEIVPERSGAGIRYRVEFSVIKDWAIPDDSVASVVASGLLSAISIDIQEGKSDKSLTPGSEIRGADQVNLFAALNDVAADFRELSREGIMPTLKNLNERIGSLASEYEDLSKSSMRPLLASVQRRVDDPELFGEIKSILKKVDDSAVRLQRLLSDRNQQHVTTTLANVEQVSVNTLDLLNRIEVTRLQMHHAVSELDRLVTDNSDEVGRTMENTATSTEDLKASMRDLRDTLKAVSENVDAIMYHVEGTSRNMHEFAREIRENPGLLFTGSPQPDQVKNKEKGGSQ